MNCLKAISHFASSRGTAFMGPWLDVRAVAAFVFMAVAVTAVGVVNLLIHSGIIYDTVELVPALESRLAFELLASAALAGMLVSNFLICRQYWLLSFVKALRTAPPRFVGKTQPPASPVYALPRAAHGSRAPPVTG